MKKIISLLLIAVMIFSTVTAVSAQETELKDDCKALLSAIGFYDESEDITINVTRGEFAYMLVNSIYDNAQLLIGSDRFRDVDEEHVYFPEISLLKALEVSVGDENANFNPDTEITLDEAIILAVRFLGYEAYAQKNGYAAAAALKELYKGINGVGMQTLTKRDALVLIYNVLNADVADQQYYNDVIYKFMNKHRNIFKIRGMVTDDGITSVSGISRINANELEIGGYTFLNLTNERGIFGYQVSGYYRTNSDSDTLELLSLIKEKSNESVVIESECIVRFDPVNSIYEYYTDEYEKEDTDEIEIPLGITIVYNGITVSPDDDFLREYYVPSKGNIVLFDSDGNGKYDLLFINSYETYIVTRVSAEDEKIYFQDQKPALETHKVDITIQDKDGNTGNLTSLTEGSVVTLSKSLNKKYVKVIYSKETLTDVITGIDADGFVYFNNGDKGKLSEYFINLAYEKEVPVDDRKETDDKLSYAIDTVKLGEIYNISLDVFGNIVSIKNSSEALWVIGYLINAGSTSRTSLSSEYQIQLYNSEFGIKSYKLAENVSLYNSDLTEERVKKDIANARIESYLSSADGNKYRLIRYRLNNDEEITRIEFPVAPTTDVTGIKDRLCVLADKSSSGTRNNGGTFPGVALTSNSTKVLLVPSDNTNNEEDYRTTDRSYYQAVSKTGNKFIAYTTDITSFTADYIVTNTTKRFGQSNYLMISSIKNMYDRENDRQYFVVTGFLNGKENTYYIEDKNLLENALVLGENATESKKIDIGDIVIFASETKDTKKYILDLRIIYDADGVFAETGLGAFGEKAGTIAGAASDRIIEDSKKYGNPVSFTDLSKFTTSTTASGHKSNDYYKVILGYVYSNSNNGIIVTTQPINGTEEYNLLKNGDVYVTDCYASASGKITYSKTLSSGKTQVRAGTDADIKPYVLYGKDCSKVVLVTYYGILYGAYIID